MHIHDIFDYLPIALFAEVQAMHLAVPLMINKADVFPHSHRPSFIHTNEDGLHLQDVALLLVLV